jgi:hypothetical protein
MIFYAFPPIPPHNRWFWKSDPEAEARGPFPSKEAAMLDCATETMENLKGHGWTREDFAAALARMFD